MKFSYSLIKKLVPKLKSKSQLLEALNLHAFEVEDLGGDVFDVKSPPNRFSDAASHWGLAREAAAVLNLKSQIPASETRIEVSKQPKNFKIVVEDKNLCPRYTAQYFENVKIGPSPTWLQKVLKGCGLRPINNVVDVMNYAMLETGQPLHAFDFDKLEGKKLIIRKAKKDETVTSIDGLHYELTPSMLVIADAKRPQAIAGIKGGQNAEVTSETKRILVESANFDSVSIYKTSKSLNLITDASFRFSHGLNLALPETGINRAAALLEEIVGAVEGERFDSLTKDLPRRVLKFDIGKFNSFIGTNLGLKDAETYLSRLGFKKISKDKWEIPFLRDDIQTHEDLAEEVIRLYGYNKLKPEAPHVALRPSESDDVVLLKDKVRRILSGFGLDEICNYSLSEKGEVEILNPVSEDKRFLRPSLLPGLLKSVEDNFRFFDQVRIFEIGKVFQKAADGVREKLILGIALGVKKDVPAGRQGEVFFEMKGIIDELLKGLGLVDFFMRNITVENRFLENGLQIESDHTIVGYLGQRQNGISLAEFDAEKLLTLVEGESSFEPLSKFPSVMRDVSILVNADARIGEIVRIIQQSNTDLIEDVDLIDEYIDEKWQNLQSLTFRIVFQAEDRTLTSVEVDDEMEKITRILRQKFNARIR